MASYVLVLIMLATPDGQTGGYASSVVIDGFKTEQECKNALNGITVPSAPSSRVTQRYTKQCVAKTL